MVSLSYLDKKKDGLKKGKRANSLNVLEVVQPIDRNKSRTRYCYGKVKVEQLSKQVLKKIFKESNSDIDVFNEEEYFSLQYKNHRILKISKKNGLFYSKHKEMNQEARIIWEILRKNGFIENPYRRVINKPLLIKWG